MNDRTYWTAYGQDENPDFAYGYADTRDEARKMGVEAIIEHLKSDKVLYRKMVNMSEDKIREALLDNYSSEVIHPDYFWVETYRMPQYMGAFYVSTEPADTQQGYHPADRNHPENRNR